MLARHRPLLALILLLLAVVGVAAGLGGGLMRATLTEALIMVVVVVGLYIFIGNSGVLSFGHIAFMAIGAYAAAWATVPLPLKRLTMPGLPGFLHENNVPVWPSALLAGLLAALVALAVGWILLRLTGIAASIATLAVLAVVNIGYSNWDPVTLGTSSIVGLPPYATLPVALLWAVIAIAVAWAHQQSRSGLKLRAAREDEVAAAAAGIGIRFHRLVAWVLSAFFVAIGGVLYGHFLGTISVDAFWLEMTFITLAMLVVGGMRSLAGAVIGVIAISTLVELLRQVEKGVTIGDLTVAAPPGLQEIGLAVVMLLILIFRPDGLMGDRELDWKSSGGTVEQA